MNWLAANSFNNCVVGLISGVSAYTIFRLLSRSLKSKYDVRYRDAVIRLTPARTEDQIISRYLSGLYAWGPARHEPFKSDDIRQDAPWSFLFWARTLRTLIWIMWVFLPIGLAPAVYERVGIGDLGVGQFGPDRHQMYSPYRFIINPFFDYLKFVVHAPFPTMFFNVFIDIILSIYAFSPRARSAMNTKILKIATMLGLRG